VSAWLAERDPAILATGPGLSKVVDPVVRRAVEAVWHPTAAGVLAVGSVLPPADPFTLVPLYLRPSAAEQQWDARGT
jgi:hypothetical protein